MKKQTPEQNKRYVANYRAHDPKRFSEMLVRKVKKYRQRYPEKARAHWTVRDAVKQGKLIKPAHCQDCGKRCKVQAHHDDYKRPLEVIWVCFACHRARHLTPTVESQLTVRAQENQSGTV